MKSIGTRNLPIFRLASALCAAACAVVLGAPAGATDWDSVDGWDVREIGTAGCVVGRVFAQGPTTFGIILGLDGDVRIFATRAGWTMRAGDAVPARVALDGKPLSAGRFVGIEQRQHKGFVVAAPPGFVDRLAAATQLALSAGPDQALDPLQLTGTAAGLAQGRRCVANLREETRLRPVATAPAQAVAVGVAAPRMASAVPSGVQARSAAARAIPRKPRASWVTTDDYPDSALRAEEEGSVTVKLAINTGGGVAGCDIVRSSGSSALDGATCSTVRRRARYRPATDGSGRAIEGVDNHTVRWSLPR